MPRTSTGLIKVNIRQKSVDIDLSKMKNYLEEFRYQTTSKERSAFLLDKEKKIFLGLIIENLSDNEFSLLVSHYKPSEIAKLIIRCPRKIQESLRELLEGTELELPTIEEVEREEAAKQARIQEHKKALAGLKDSFKARVQWRKDPKESFEAQLIRERKSRQEEYEDRTSELAEIQQEGHGGRISQLADRRRDRAYSPFT